jgi:hypothetical protein
MDEHGLNTTGNVHVNVTLWGVGVTVVSVEKQSSITYCACVSVALATRYAQRMRRILICGLSIPYFSTLSHKRHDIRKNEKKCVLIPYTNSV